MSSLDVTAARCDALFVSALQRDDVSDGAVVQDAIRGAVRAFGVRGCAARVAQEFGDHPDLAVQRMRWVRGVLLHPAAAHPMLRLAPPARDDAGHPAGRAA